MDVFYKRSDIERRLTQRFHEYQRKDVALTGILLARPEDKITKEAILPNLEYWSYRSDSYTDFFCAGYIPEGFVSDARSVGVSIGELEWAFSLPAFVDIVNSIERETEWSYQGDPCLLVLNSYFDGNAAHLDFRRSLRLNFRDALDDKAASTPTQLAEAIFEFAKHVNAQTTDPVWELSDYLGHRVIKDGFKDALLTFLPSWLSPSTKKAMHFAVKQLGTNAEPSVPADRLRRPLN